MNDVFETRVVFGPEDLTAIAWVRHETLLEVHAFLSANERV